jgi:exonuclease SbcC
MWITRLQLSNIKSYGENSAPIYFSEGVNLIQGHNGAGKSTILESIGLALFDSDSSYNSQQFVREGAKAGTIVLGFISAVDEREYEVIRGVGAQQVCDI